MTYPSVDYLQKVLAESVFHYAKDAKKAAGRALGTLVEVITFYLLKAWGFEKHVAIERPLPEYQNREITHNVEYSMHPSDLVARVQFTADDLPISVRKIVLSVQAGQADFLPEGERGRQLLSKKLVLRNACTLADEGNSFLVGTLESYSEERIVVAVHRLLSQPYAIAECKQVGLEEGTRKGPQTIEKAKQGAYVARTVSSLQRIRLSTGELGGVVHQEDGRIVCKRYEDFLEEVINSCDARLLKGFILTVGVVSNHGNWFTSDNHNKELKVIAQSYDWLLFLSDEGLSEFIRDLVLEPADAWIPVRETFLASYSGKSGSNQFTKVQMGLAADMLLRRYFSDNLSRIHRWFNVISPRARCLDDVRQELGKLAAKPWSKIHA